MTIKTRNIANNAITAAKLTSTLATGFIELPLHNWRAVQTNDMDVVAVTTFGSGGVLGRDATPVLERVSTSTDKAERIKSASSGAIEIAQPVRLPDDYDQTVGMVFHIRTSIGSGGGATTDFAAVFTVGFWLQGAVGAYVLSVDGGGATQSYATAFAAANPVIAQASGAGAIVELTAAIAAPSTAAQKLASVPGAVVNATITPGTHTTDTQNIYATWITYARK
jgi:hypothetical protein